MTCHFCGQPGSGINDGGTQCLNCGKWFCKGCVDRDSHECFSTLLDTDQAAGLVAPEPRARKFGPTSIPYLALPLFILLLALVGSFTVGACAVYLCGLVFGG